VNASAALTADQVAARPAGRSGFSAALLRIELRRLLRNRRTFFFTLVFPILMLLIVDSSIPADQRSIGHGVIADVGAYLMVSMALYGVAMAATTGGAAIATERASGWSRQLRTSPLSPGSYILLKIVTSMVLASAALLASYAAGKVLGIAHMALGTWVLSGLIILVGAVVFAGFGLFVGYLVPSENVMQFVGPLLALLGFLGGLFQGPIDTATTMGRIQSLTPIYGLQRLAHWPLTLTRSGGYDHLDVWWVVNLACWGALFVAGAVWCFRRDTARV
jgi:ABC-2 type transport system permease protein